MLNAPSGGSPSISSGRIATVVEGEEQVRTRHAQPHDRLGVERILHDERLDAVRLRELGDAREPARLVGMVAVRREEDDALTALEQVLQTRVPGVRVGEDGEAGHDDRRESDVGSRKSETGAAVSLSPRPYTRRMRKRGRPRTCW